MMPKLNDKFLIPLMCFIEERGGATLITNDTTQRLWAKLGELKPEDVCVGIQPVPDGVLVVNLIGEEAIKAWEAGSTPEVKEEKPDEKDKDQGGKDVQD